MRLRTQLAIGALQCSFLLASAQTPGTPTQAGTPKPSKQQSSSQPSSATPDNPGERKFRQNCSRCHNAPEELHPRIAGTVLLHMRVRASLSAADERDILRYLAP
jgi:cytochrome c5